MSQPLSDQQSTPLARMGAAEICLLAVGDDQQTSVLKKVALERQWLTIDVDLIIAEEGPWKGHAMPGSPEGCGIFACADSRTYTARADDKGIYLSATLDQLLQAHGVRCICLVGDAQDAFVEAIRSFAVMRGYRFQLGTPPETYLGSQQQAKPTLHDFVDRVSPEKAALILIDFQNDFCAGAGAAGRTGATMKMVGAAVRGARGLLEAAREHGVFVVHVRAEYGRPWRSSSSPYRFPVSGRREPAVWTASAADHSTNQWFDEDETEVCRTGTWGAEFVEGLTPRPGEPVVTKHRFGAFASTGLDHLLRAHGISNLIMAGVTTNCCVETAAREAVMREFNLVVAEDCVGVKDHLEDLHRATLEALGTYFGLVRPSSDIIAAWRARPASERRVPEK